MTAGLGRRSGPGVAVIVAATAVRAAGIQWSTSTGISGAGRPAAGRTDRSRAAADACNAQT